MLGGEILVLGVLALAVIALVGIVRRERLARAAGQPSTVHAFRVGLYRGLAVAVVLFVGYAAVMMVMNAVSRPPAGY